MFRVELVMKKLPGEPSNFVHNTTVSTWEDAQQKGMSSACMAGTISVAIYTEEGQQVASYNRLDNFWCAYTHRDEFVSADDYFTLHKNRAVEGAKAQGFNIEILREENGLYKVVAGHHAVLLERTMIPWINDICSDVLVSDLNYFDDDAPQDKTPDEWFRFFAQRLQKRVDEALERNPQVDTLLRK